MRFVANHHGDNVFHGAARKGRVTPEYRAYHGAKCRCTNPNEPLWKYYGGRGIKFLFISFEEFFACVGPRPIGMSLDRINNNGHYEPGNMRWATRSQQRRNRRTGDRFHRR